MVISLDKLCCRYNILPSYAVKEADTFDMWVMDVALRYELIQQQKKDGTYDPNEHYTQDELMAILQEAKNNGN